ncbi:myelin and lymphocyte protein-like isoform X2 [Polyodon spathula]|uniref:myelin and lymphocyte protein-like isoform X2 n=1 Tax=Polyodon spathula TaxID=7913 RepID=UPI001B7E608A|nr:myelin and lymphocyte protein-like isoform X2 [Polyodon spathula]
MESETQGISSLPSGLGVFTTVPDVFFIPELDVACHGIAALFYMSASVAQAFATITFQNNLFLFNPYQENIAAVVFSYIATMLYVIHVVFSAYRWKTS